MFVRQSTEIWFQIRVCKHCKLRRSYLLVYFKIKLYVYLLKEKRILSLWGFIYLFKRPLPLMRAKIDKSHFLKTIAIP